MVCSVFLLLGVLVVVMVIWFSRRHARGGAPTEPACGSCGYPVRGLQSMQCPECGCDFRQVGIVAGNRHYDPGRLGLVLMWTVCLPIAAVIVTLAAAETLIPERIERSHELTLASPRSNAYRQLYIHAEVGRWQWPWERQPLQNLPYETIQVELMPIQTGPRYMYIDAATGQWRYDDDGQTVTGQGVNMAAILDWWKSSGVAVAGDQVKDEAATIAAAILSLQARHGSGGATISGSGYFSSTSSGSSQYSHTPDWIAAANFAFWFLLWLAGVAYFIWGKNAGTATTATMPPRPNA